LSILIRLVLEHQTDRETNGIEGTGGIYIENFDKVFQTVGNPFVAVVSLEGNGDASSIDEDVELTKFLFREIETSLNVGFRSYLKQIRETTDRYDSW